MKSLVASGIVSLVLLLGTPCIYAQAVIVPSPVPSCSNGDTLVWQSSSSSFICTTGAAASQPLTDAVGLIKNASNATKILAFNVAGISSSTTRTWTIPDANISIPATIAALSNNTFTGLQTMNGGFASTTGTLSSTLGVTGAATFSSTVAITGNLTLSGTGNAVGTITSGIWNAGAITSNGFLTVNGTANTNKVSFGSVAPPTTNTLNHLFVGSAAWIAQEAATGETDLGMNFYYNSGYKYRVTDPASKVQFYNGTVTFSTAPSGSANAAITWGDRLVISSAGHLLPGADNTYNLGTAGTMRWKDIFAVTKTSSLDVSWGSKNVLVSVLEGPEYRLYDSGTVTLDASGQATVTLDPHYVEVTNTAIPYQVMASGASVRNKTATGFALRGQPNDVVDWMISATRAGFENVRWRDLGTEKTEPLGLADPWDARNRKSGDNNTPKEPARRKPEDLPPAKQAAKPAVGVKP